MSFVETFNGLEMAELTVFAQRASSGEVSVALGQARRLSLSDFATLISPEASHAPHLETLAQRAQALTVKHFGRVIRLFAPLYLSNECINICKYCGFSRDNPILRVTLTPEQVLAEARYLRDEGFRHILLVAGEHPHFVSERYVVDCIERLHADWPSISLEIGPMETADYVPMVGAGAEGLVVYQETYDRAVYQSLHASGPKTNFDWRLETAERAYAAGFKRLGIGALLGLAAWRAEAMAVAAHVEYLLKKCWQAQITVSVPRLRPAAGEFKPLVTVTDRDLVQFICAMRLTFPQVGIVLSTREAPQLRDRLIPLGVTMISAGSHTEPGGYTGQGKDELHLTRRGKHLKPGIESEGKYATEQFEIADARTPAEMAERLTSLGYEPVWKDWETVLNEA